MKQYITLSKSLIATATATIFVVLSSTPPVLSQSPDAKLQGNQAQLDPFAETHKTPPIDWVKVYSETQKKNPLADKIQFHVTATPSEARPGELVKVTAKGVLQPGWHTYGMNVTTDGQYTSKFLMGAVQGLQPIGPIAETPSPTPSEPIAGSRTWEHSKEVSWSFDVLITPEAKSGKSILSFAVDLQVCKGVCIFDKVPLEVPITVLPGDAVVVSDDVKNRIKEKFPPRAVEKTPEGSIFKAPTGGIAKSAPIPQNYQASIDRLESQIRYSGNKPGQGKDGTPVESLMTFVLAGVFWGFISLITPCVFPMIPITVSFFMKQSEKEHHKPVTMALVYCGTIVVVLTFAAVALLSFFQMLSINPLMNIGLGILFIFFALSLFGMYDIELPSFMARYTSEREGKGGMVGTMFMALTFTIISFACVAPFLGGFGGTASAASRPFWHTILGGLAFSITFAAPFFFLALFPTLLRAMPKSGTWLNSVKVVMGFLELAAAFKFFRAGELRMVPTPTLFTFDLVLGFWVAICFLCGLYLLNVYRLPHDSPVEHLSVPRMLFSFLFLGLGLHLLPALFIKSAEDEAPRPDSVISAWVISFILPDTKDELWAGNLEDVVLEAKKYQERTGKPKLIFVDFTGVNCSNCRLNESNVFTKYEIRHLLKEYALVRMYTDTVPAVYYSPDDRAKADQSRRDHDATINLAFQKKVFDSVQRPLYAILEPRLDGTIQVLGQYDEAQSTASQPSLCS